MPTNFDPTQLLAENGVIDLSEASEEQKAVLNSLSSHEVATLLLIAKRFAREADAKDPMPLKPAWF